MRLFITGAAGYIGLNVSLAFRRAGYRVFGLIPSREKAALLECNEIIPVVGNLQESQGFQDVVGMCDIIIHTPGDLQSEMTNQGREAVSNFLEGIHCHSRAKTIIYTSSTWVLGNCQGRPLTERSPYAPIQMVSNHPAIERLVLQAQPGRGLVMRPGVVYGKGGGLTGMWFHGVTNGGVVRIAGDGQNHWAMVHVDDLARAFLLATQSGCAGEAFNLVDPARSTVMEMVSAAAQAAGNIRQLEFVPVENAAQEMGALAQALALDQVADAGKAHRLLGWHPRHKSFVSEVDTYYRAWRASHS